MGSLLTKHDKDLSEKFIFTIGVGDDKLLFQFPPRVSSDGRKGSWQEGELRGREPIAVFQTSGPREITVTATYIVDGTSGWGADKIHKQIQMARGYFARVRSGNATRDLVCRIKMWQIGGSDPMTARLTNVGVKYSDTLVGPADSAFPLRTDLTLDVRLWTKGGGTDDKGKKDEVVDVPGLKGNEDKEWY